MSTRSARRKLLGAYSRAGNRDITTSEANAIVDHYARILGEGFTTERGTEYSNESLLPYSKEDVKQALRVCAISGGESFEEADSLFGGAYVRLGYFQPEKDVLLHDRYVELLLTHDHTPEQQKEYESISEPAKQLGERVLAEMRVLREEWAAFSRTDLSRVKHPYTLGSGTSTEG